MTYYKSKLRKLRVLIIILFALLFLAIISAVCGFVYYKHSLSAVDPGCTSGDCEVKEFTVEENDSVAEVARVLEENGLIRSAFVFRLYYKLEAKDLVIQSGTYSISKDMTVQRIAQNFNAGPDMQTFTITFLPGGTLADARVRLKDKGYTDNEITAAFNANYEHELLASKPAGASIEGYIYGETYEFYVGTPVEDILTRTFDQMWGEIQNSKLEDGFKKQGLTVHEAVVLASVVQKESGIIPDDMPQVAQVFLSRLALGIPLGSDAIIGYYADQQDPNRDKTDMSYLDSTPCPWNSRKCGGLPPTPISSPGAGALAAVANPAEGDYLYFLTGDDGKMHYGRTEAEHNLNIEQYCQELCGYL
jgi:UPF0755 protein